MKSVFFGATQFVCFLVVAYYTCMKARWFQDFAYVCMLYALFLFQTILQNALPAGFLAPAGSPSPATALTLDCARRTAFGRPKSQMDGASQLISLQSLHKFASNQLAKTTVSFP